MCCTHFNIFDFEADDVSFAINKHVENLKESSLKKEKIDKKYWTIIVIWGGETFPNVSFPGFFFLLFLVFSIKCLYWQIQQMILFVYVFRSCSINDFAQQFLASHNKNGSCTSIYICAEASTTSLYIFAWHKQAFGFTRYPRHTPHVCTWLSIKL